VDKLVGYFADIVEFLVGGMLVGVASLLLLHAVAPDALPYDSLSDLPAEMSTPISLVALGLVYALGVFAEGVSRLATEWRLRVLTADRYPEAPAAWPEPNHGFTPAEREREIRRSRLRHANPSGSSEVDGQLKRLRIERTLLLALCIAAAAAVAAREPWWSGLLVVLAGASARLVDERFRRFLEAIDRGHAKPEQPARSTTSGA
jgi:hypothetical protein